MTHVVVNADDLGIAHGVNAAIARAFRTGILTSASVMANMPAFRDAVETVITPNPRLGIGIHLILTSGPCVAEPRDVPLLVDSQGTFRHGFFEIRRLVRGAARAVALAQIERELRAQCEKVLAAGISVDHVDGHRHVHMIPEIWRIVVRLSAEYGWPYVRLADERWNSMLSKRRVDVFVRNVPKKILLSGYARRNRRFLSEALLPRTVRVSDHLIGILDSDAITAENLRSRLSHLASGITEVVVHPGLRRHAGAGVASASSDTQLVCAPMDARFVSSPNRQRELEALTHPSVLSIARQRLHLTSFGELSKETPRAA
jgi:predicted glycoside hydrolase/deacetylase ChbG (UPF0249 family)